MTDPNKYCMPCGLWPILCPSQRIMRTNVGDRPCKAPLTVHPRSAFKHQQTPTEAASRSRSESTFAKVSLKSPSCFAWAASWSFVYHDFLCRSKAENCNYLRNPSKYILSRSSKKELHETLCWNAGMLEQHHIKVASKWTGDSIYLTVVKRGFYHFLVFAVT